MVFSSKIDTGKLGFETETFNMLARQINMAEYHTEMHQTKLLVDVMISIFIAAKFKLQTGKKVSLSDDFRERLLAMEDKVYAKRITDEFQQTILFKEVRLLWEELAYGLAEAGLMYRVTKERSERAFVNG